VLTLKEPKSGRAVETVPMQGALTSAVTTTIAVVCVNVSDPAVNLIALFTQIAALQTSHNG